MWDEPFQGIDPARRFRIAGFVRQRFKYLGSSALVTGHDAADLLAMCDRVLLMGADGNGVVDCGIRLAEHERVFSDAVFGERRQELETLLRARGINDPPDDQASRLMT